MEREPKPTGELPGRVILPQRPKVKWPGDSRLAVLLTFDCYGGEAFSTTPFIGTLYDFGPRRGIWHILESLDKLGVQATFHVPGVTAEVYPRVVKAMVQAGHEVAALGYRYRPHWDFGETEERENIQKAITAIEGVAGTRPKGWRTPESRPSVYTLQVASEAGFAWDSSLRNDELPYGLEFEKGSILEIPYGGATDSVKYYGFPMPPVPAHMVLSVWQDELDVLYKESRQQCSMLIMCLHPAFDGRPAELDALEQFIIRIKQLDGTWFARGSDIADWWAKNQNWH